MSELSPRRWAYLKQLRPSRGKYLHYAVNGTYDVGRNEAKRERRAKDKEARARRSRVIEQLCQSNDRKLASLQFNMAARRQRGQCN